jgi:uncharacterized protein (TIGR00369 family)
VPSEDNAAALELLNAGFVELVPHNKAIGFSLIELGSSPSYVVARIPWDERFVGNPETGVMHGGIVTTFLDAAGGAAVYVKIQKPVPIATLDLRIDYLKPGTGRRDIRARAECIKVTRNVAFVRAFGYHDDPSDPIALASATYMISTKGKAVVLP